MKVALLALLVLILTLHNASPPLSSILLCLIQRSYRVYMRFLKYDFAQTNGVEQLFGYASLL